MFDFGEMGDNLDRGVDGILGLGFVAVCIYGGAKAWEAYAENQRFKQTQQQLSANHTNNQTENNSN